MQKPLGLPFFSCYNYLSIASYLASFPEISVNLLDRKWVRTWCRMREIATKMRGMLNGLSKYPCWPPTRAYGTLNATNRYWIIITCMSPAITQLRYGRAVPGLRRVLFSFCSFADRGYLRSQAYLVAVRRELSTHHALCVMRVSRIAWGLRALHDF